MVAAAIVGAPSSTSAQPGVQPIMLDVSTAHPWAVEVSRLFMSRYIRARLTYGACEAGRSCIVIREVPVRSGEVAETVYNRPNRGDATIYLSPGAAYLGWYTKERIVVHEMAHALGVHWHDETCSQGVMYSEWKCPDGTLPPLQFTVPEMRVLSRR